MRNKILYFLFLLTTLFLPTSSAFALDANDFYFDSFIADYYLSKNSDNSSTLKVVETLTAVFPYYDQNHGITRQIPFTNQDGKNLTVQNQSALNLSVTHNGHAEPFSIDSDNNAFNVRIGDANSYVHGPQTYTLTYEFTNVITDFNDYQELYWDTNGTGWYQNFRTLTARLHFSNDVKELWSGKSWCYVGSYGENGQSRCVTTNIDDGVQFTTQNLAPTENLTFDVEFQPNSFTIPQPNQSTIATITTLLLLVTFAPYIIYIVAIYYIHQKTKLPKSVSKSSTVPQYTPPQNFAIAEAAQLYGRKKISALSKSKVATLIELAVNHKIQLIQTKGPLGSTKWQIKVLSTTNLTDKQRIALQILNGGLVPADNAIIDIKNQRYSSRIEQLGRDYDNHDFLKTHNYIRDYKLSSLPLIIIIIAMLTSFLLFGFAESLVPIPYRYISTVDTVIIISTICSFLAFMLGIIAISFYTIRRSAVCPTDSGIEIINHLSGLNYYMSLAETERIKFLQSIDNIDTSPEGIVNLYEKLLPYAIIFGLEKSWLKTLNHYYETMSNSDHVYWYAGTPIFDLSDFNSFNAYTSSSINSSSSSSSSGGGGGGFSGGGGGGGGGGGW